jgi:hypothetical protein
MLKIAKISKFRVEQDYTEDGSSKRLGNIGDKLPFNVAIF